MIFVKNPKTGLTEAGHCGLIHTFQASSGDEVGECGSTDKTPLGDKATNRKKNNMLQKSTRGQNPGDARKWYLVDAKDQVLGRLAVLIANKLRAKDSPNFDPSVDQGAFVI